MDEKQKELANQFHAALSKVYKEKPKPEDVKAFKAALQKTPEMWRVIGDLAEQAQRRIIAELKGAPEYLQASLHTGIAQMKKELARRTDTPLEEMLIDQIILCWLRLYETDQYYTAAHGAQSISHSSSQYWERRLNAAQARHLKAIETLARVRRLNRPQVQLNIADKQVNIAQGAAQQVTAPNVVDAETVTI